MKEIQIHEKHRRHPDLVQAEEVVSNPSILFKVLFSKNWEYFPEPIRSLVRSQILFFVSTSIEQRNMGSRTYIAPSYQEFSQIKLGDIPLYFDFSSRVLEKSISDILEIYKFLVKNSAFPFFELCYLLDKNSFFLVSQNPEFMPRICFFAVFIHLLLLSQSLKKN